MTTGSPEPSFSFVTPAFNEQRHIGAALESVLAQSYNRFDMIVVDDGSTDGTRDVVEMFASDGRVHLVIHERSRGSGAGRNSGVDRAQGEIVVFLDADVTVPHDFLERLAVHYSDGADAVAVESRVADQGFVPARFQQAVHEISYPEMRGFAFTQAFSCRRSIAKSLRFPEELPGTAADDAAFSVQFLAGDYALVRDPTLIVDHTLPTTTGGLKRQAVKRGRAVVHFDRHIRGRSRRATVLRRVAVSLRALLGIVLVVPAVVRAARLASHSCRGTGDTAAFWLLHHVYLVCYHSGQLAELRRMSRMEPAK